MSRRDRTPVKVGREEVRLSRRQRNDLEPVLREGADHLYALPFEDQPTLEGYTLRATERGFHALLEIIPPVRIGTPLSGLSAKILDALDRYSVRMLEESQ